MSEESKCSVRFENRVVLVTEVELTPEERGRLAHYWRVSAEEKGSYSAVEAFTNETGVPIKVVGQVIRSTAG